MRRSDVRLIVVWLLLSTLCACDVLREWVEQQQPDTPPPAAAEPSIERAQPAYQLGRDLILTPGLQLVDVHDGAVPRVVAEYRMLDTTQAFYRVDDHVLVIIQEGWEYAGARSDVTVSRMGGLRVLNIDIHDQAHPTLIDSLPLTGNHFTDSCLRRGTQGAELYMLTASLSDMPGDFLESVQLRDGHLNANPLQYVYTRYSGTSPERINVATADWLVIEVPGNERYLQVWRIDSGVPVRGQYISISDYIFPNTELQISDGVLRVPHQAWSGNDFIFVVESFVLALDTDFPSGTASSGSCNLTAEVSSSAATGELFYEHGAPVHFLANDVFMAWALDRDSNEHVQRYSLDAQGNCQRIAAPSSCSDPPLPAASGMRTREYFSEPELSVSVERAHEADSEQLSLYGDPCFSPFAQIQLGTTHTYQVQSARLRSNVPKAEDGTRETGLLAFSCFDTASEGQQSCAQLVTYSDHTLTRRAHITTPSLPSASLIFPDATLALLAPPGLITYDLRSLDAPRELGSLQLSGYYPQLFHFGAYMARIESDLSKPPDVLEVSPLSAASDRDPLVARVDTGARGDWLQLDDLLLKIEHDAASVAFQLYDLSDPAHPRRAGRLETQDITVPTRDIETGELNGIRAVGHALVISHATPDNSLTFDVIDLRDREQPQLVRPALSLGEAAPGQQLVGDFVSGASLYENIALDVSQGKYALRVLDFSDPQSPQLSPSIAVPAPIRLALGRDLYAQTRENELATLTRIRIDGASAQAQVTRSWPGYFGAAELASDAAGHLYALYRESPQHAGDRGAWTTLFVLDEQTLEQLGSVPIDSYASQPRIANGRMLVEASGVSLLVDVRDSAAPRVQSFIRHGYLNQTLIVGDQVFRYGIAGVAVLDATTSTF